MSEEFKEVLAPLFENYEPPADVDRDISTWEEFYNIEETK